MLLSLTSAVNDLTGLYPGQDTRGPSTPFAVTQDAAKSKWEQGLSDFLRGAGISINASGSGVSITDTYKSDAQTPPVPFLGDPNNRAASLLSSPLVLVGGGVILALVVRKLLK